MKNSKKFDYYTVQIWVDGFGNDTCVVFSSKDYHECEKYIENTECVRNESHAIVGQHFNKEFYNQFE